MIGLDSNTLVRFLVEDDEAQVRRIREALESAIASGQRFWVCSVVTAEVSWVLGSLYEYSRDEIAGALEKLLDVVQLEHQEAPALRLALADFRGGSGDLADCLIGRLGREHGCETTLTFDKGLRRNVHFRQL